MIGFLPDGDYRFVRHAGFDRGVRQPMQFLEVGIAEHEPVVGVPQHECFRDGLDRIAQPHVGGGGLLHQRLLLGDVDGDADQVQPRFAVLPRQFAARPQPQPAPVGVAHAEGMVDRLHVAARKLPGKIVEVDVAFMHQRVDFAEIEQFVFRRQAENVEHRARPEHPPAREVPVPQSAAAAVERGIDAAAHGVVNDVGLAGARRLPVKGEAEDQHHEAGGSRQRHRQRGARAPAGKRAACGFDHGYDAQRVAQAAHRGERGGAARQRDFQRAGGGAERGQGLRRSENVEQRTADLARIVGNGGDDRAFGVGNQYGAVAAGRPRRQHARERGRGACGLVCCIFGGTVERHRHFVGECFDGLARVEHGLTALLEHLYHGTDADGDEEGYDENRNGAAQQRLRAEQPPIRGLGDRFCQPLNQIGS